MSEYGSWFRQAMFKSMEKPAGEWKPTNRREDRPSIWQDLLYIAVGVSAVVGFWFSYIQIVDIVRHH